MLGLYDISSGYGKKLVLQDISFEIKESGVYIVLGRNGADKTTLLRTIMGVFSNSHETRKFLVILYQVCPNILYTLQVSLIQGGLLP
ncbi:MAG: ATP-binding cassette domain-containing protein [Sulfolobaceae archaeon]